MLPQADHGRKSFVRPAITDDGNMPRDLTAEIGVHWLRKKMRLYSDASARPKGARAAVATSVETLPILYPAEPPK